MCFDPIQAEPALPEAQRSSWKKDGMRTKTETELREDSLDQIALGVVNLEIHSAAVVAHAVEMREQQCAAD